MSGRDEDSFAGVHDDADPEPCEVTGLSLTHSDVRSITGNAMHLAQIATWFAYCVASKLGM